MAETKEQEQPATSPQEQRDKPVEKSSTAEGGKGANPGNGSEAPKKKRSPVVYGVLAIVVIIALIFGVRSYLFNRVHASTDDAYVTGDLVNISPQINGTLQTLMVQKGDWVKKGELIAILDPSGPQAALRQAQANFDAAVSQIPTAQRNLEYQKLATAAAVQKAQAALAAQKSKTQGARDQVALTSGTFTNTVQQSAAQVKAANANWQQAKAQIASAQASRDNYVQAVQTAQDGQANFEQQILTAQQAVQSANSKAKAAQAVAEKASHDEDRAKLLYSEDAISAQSLDQARSAALNAVNQFDAARADAQQAASQFESARKAAAQSRSQVEQARKAVSQANAQVVAFRKASDASEEQVHVAEAGLRLANANAYSVSIQQTNLNSAGQQVDEAAADVATAKSGAAQVRVRELGIKTAEAQAAQAKAELTNAQINLSYTKIYSPTDGQVVEKDTNVGATLAPGTTILTLSRGDLVWVTANFKETQLADVRPNEPAEVEVDMFPGKVFKAKVRDIDEATGAATALLPPDNATGNFTKVVQRIPVRIDLIPASSGDDKSYATQEDITALRQGTSVTATIDTSHRDDFPARVETKSKPEVATYNAASPEPAGAGGSSTSSTASDSPIDSSQGGTTTGSATPTPTPAQPGTGSAGSSSSPTSPKSPGSAPAGNSQSSSAPSSTAPTGSGAANGATGPSSSGGATGGGN